MLIHLKPHRFQPQKSPETRQLLSSKLEVIIEAATSWIFVLMTLSGWFKTCRKGKTMILKTTVFCTFVQLFSLLRSSNKPTT